MNLELIKELACEEFGPSFTSRSRVRDLVYQRAAYFKLCRDHTPYSLHDIGKTLGYNHATVLHLLKIFDRFELWNENKILNSYIVVNNKLKEMRGLPSISRKDFYRRILHKNINLKGQLSNIKKN